MLASDSATAIPRQSASICCGRRGSNAEAARRGSQRDQPGAVASALLPDLELNRQARQPPATSRKPFAVGRRTGLLLLDPERPPGAMALNRPVRSVPGPACWARSLLGLPLALAAQRRLLAERWQALRSIGAPWIVRRPLLVAVSEALISEAEEPDSRGRQRADLMLSNWPSNGGTGGERRTAETSSQWKHTAGPKRPDIF